MGNHRTMPYVGLHYSKKEPTPSLLSVALVVVGAVIAAILFLVGCYLAVEALGVPVRFSADGAPLSALVLSPIHDLLP